MAKTIIDNINAFVEIVYNNGQKVTIPKDQAYLRLEGENILIDRNNNTTIVIKGLTDVAELDDNMGMVVATPGTMSGVFDILKDWFNA